MSPSAPALPRVLRALDDAAALRAAVADVDAPRLVREAAEHGLSAVLLHALGEAHVALPGDAASALRRDAMNLAASLMKVRRLLLRAVDALAEAGLTPVLLKGPGLGARLYPEPLSRPSSDVDLLVAPEELEAAERALAGMGLARTLDAHEPDPREYHHHVTYAGPAGMVELHFRLTSGFGNDASHEALVPAFYEDAFEGRRVRYLRPAHELVYLSIHAAQHLFARLGWLYDLKLLVRRHPELMADGADEVVTLARQSGMAGAVHAALFIAREVVGLRVAGALLERIRPLRFQPALLSALFTDATVGGGALARNRMAAFAVRALLVDSPGAMARHLWDGTGRELTRAVRRRWAAHGR